MDKAYEEYLESLAEGQEALSFAEFVEALSSSPKSKGVRQIKNIDLGKQISDIARRTVAAQRMAEDTLLNAGSIDAALSVIYLATRILEDAKLLGD